jgi:hypothetical protein
VYFHAKHRRSMVSIPHLAQEAVKSDKHTSLVHRAVKSYTVQVPSDTIDYLYLVIGSATKSPIKNKLDLR